MFVKKIVTKCDAFVDFFKKYFVGLIVGRFKIKHIPDFARFANTDPCERC